MTYDPFTDPEVKARQAAALEWLEHVLPVAQNAHARTMNAGGDQRAALPSMGWLADHIMGLSQDELHDRLILAVGALGSVSVELQRAGGVRPW